MPAEDGSRPLEKEPLATDETRRGPEDPRRPDTDDEILLRSFYAIGLGGLRGCGCHYKSPLKVADGPCCTTEPELQTLMPEDEVELLRSEARRLESVLDSIRRRLRELETL